MNLKNVLRTYILLRQLTDDESALLDTLRNLSEPECELLVESLAPAKPAQPVRKQVERCTHVYESGLVCKATARNYVHHNSAHLDFHQFTVEKQKKSRHAQSLAGAIQRAPKSKDDEQRCTERRTDQNGRICGLLSDHNVHHMKSHAGYHPFESWSNTCAANEQSSTNGTEQFSTASESTQQDDASVAAGGGD